MRLQNIQDRYQFVPFRGGLDLVTPSQEVPPGFARQSQNVEIDVNQGYVTATGYERFDGRESPSAAQYAILGVTISGSIEVNDQITGVTSSETATVIAIADDNSYLVIADYSGEFSSGEVLNVSASPEATTTSISIPGAAVTQELDAEYRSLAANLYRTSIGAPPGSGNVLGVWMIGDDVYAVRNNAGGTAAVLHKSGAYGWTAVDLGYELTFTSGGTTEIVAGNTITGASSSATAVVGKVILTSGTWAGGDAAGRLILTSQTGNFSAENLDVGASTDLATIAADSDAITLLPSGRFETIYYNFTGSGDRKIYGCDGVNRGFEFDGTVFAPINTGMANDAPTHVIAHKFQLFFSFGPSNQHSGPGAPFSWSPILGAAEIAVGDEVTGYSAEYGSEAGAALAIYSRNSIHMLYGNSSSDWQLIRYRDEIGAFPYSIQQVGLTMMVDDPGITTLAQAQEFGNFAHTTVSKLVQPYIITRKTLVTASCVVRNKSQYRVFFSDKTALYITMEGRKLLGIMPMTLDHVVTCIISQEDASGSEVIYFGTDTGHVMQMEAGTSFDGETIDWYSLLHFTDFGSPRLLKRYMTASIEATGLGFCQFQFSFELGYGTVDLHQPNDSTLDATFNASRWDEFVWDSFWWDGQSISPVAAKMFGSAENVSLILRGSSAQFKPIKFSGINVRYAPRRYLK